MPIMVASRGKLRVMRPPNKRDEDVALLEARREAMEHRRDGMNYRQIAAAMGISPKLAYAYVQTELNEIRDQTAEDTEAQRDIEIQRCDEMLRNLGPGIRAGDPASIMTAMKVGERRAKLLGLDAPERKTVLHAVISPEDAAKLSESELLERLKRLTTLAAVALPTDNPAVAAIDGAIVDAELVDPANDDAALESATRVSIDVRGLIGRKSQNPSIVTKFATIKVASPVDFGDYDDEADCA